MNYCDDTGVEGGSIVYLLLSQIRHILNRYQYDQCWRYPWTDRNIRSQTADTESGDLWGLRRSSLAISLCLGGRRCSSSSTDGLPSTDPT